MDNRPLQFDEFLERVPQLVHVSATPNEWEITQSRRATRFNDKPPHGGVVEQLVRPTGILDPQIEIRPSEGQIPNLMSEINKRVKKSQRVLVTTLTKRMAEDLSEYLKEKGVKVSYLHSDVLTLERSDILDDLRRGEYDVLVGINLLREGLDLPEVSLVAILDADKEGFLRSDTSLVQTMGRAARHIDGRVIMYADKVTGSMERAIEEVNRRRKIQEDYNKEHGITPISIQKKVREKLVDEVEELEEGIREGLYTEDDIAQMLPREKQSIVKKLSREMKLAAKDLRFEDAARYRDEIQKIK
jgi:excinuclease ABC subunit B